MPKLKDLIQSTPEWHAWRKWKIGASMAPVIMGVSPFQTPLQLWDSIVLAETKEPNYAMERGSRLEARSRDLFNRDQRGLEYIPVCVEHDSIPWMIASLDGAIVYSNFGAPHGSCEVRSAIEIKCPGKEAHNLALNGKVPDYYYPQLQHQMVVCNITHMTYISFDGEENVEIIVKRDDEYITKQLMPKLAAFYGSLIDFKPPSTSDKDVVEINDPRAILEAREYDKVTRQIEDLQEIQSSIRSKLIEYAGTGRVSIGNLKITKVMRKGSINYTSIPELENVNLDEYRNEPVVSWRIN